MDNTCLFNFIFSALCWLYPPWECVQPDCVPVIWSVGRWTQRRQMHHGHEQTPAEMQTLPELTFAKAKSQPDQHFKWDVNVHVRYPCCAVICSLVLSIFCSRAGGYWWRGTQLSGMHMHPIFLLKLTDHLWSTGTHNKMVFYHVYQQSLGEEESPL